MFKMYSCVLLLINNIETCTRLLNYRFKFRLAFSVALSFFVRFDIRILSYLSLIAVEPFLDVLTYDISYEVPVVDGTEV